MLGPGLLWLADPLTLNLVHLVWLCHLWLPERPSAGRMATWLTGWLSDCFTAWLASWFCGWLAASEPGWLTDWLAGCLSEAVWYMMWFSVVAINGLAEQLHPLITPPKRAGAVPNCKPWLRSHHCSWKINKASFMICRLWFWNVFTLPFASKFQFWALFVVKNTSEVSSSLRLAVKDRKMHRFPALHIDLFWISPTHRCRVWRI